MTLTTYNVTVTNVNLRSVGGKVTANICLQQRSIEGRGFPIGQQIANNIVYKAVIHICDAVEKIKTN